jgi:hypothetical protein
MAICDESIGNEVIALLFNKPKKKAMLKKWFLLLIIVVVLPSCKSMFTMNAIMDMHKGASPDEVEKMLGLEPKEQFSVSQLGKDYSVKVYKVLIGTEKKYGQQLPSATQSYPPPGGKETPAEALARMNRDDTRRMQADANKTKTVELTSDYLFLFDSNKKLVFWGFLEEFSKNEDAFVAGIAPKIQDTYYSLKNN